MAYQLRRQRSRERAQLARQKSADERARAASAMVAEDTERFKAAQLDAAIERTSSAISEVVGTIVEPEPENDDILFGGFGL